MSATSHTVSSLRVRRYSATWRPRRKTRSVLRVGELDFSGPQPKVVNARDVVTSQQPMKVYHIDWSPDGKYVAYSRGPAKKRLGLIPEIVGVRAEGWDIYVADPAVTNRVLQITTDGHCNKEPDWVPVERNTP